MSILLKDVALYQNGEIHEHSNIVVDGKSIREFPKHPRNEDYDEVIYGKNMLALPGLVNTHTHVAMTLFRSYADDLALMDWLQNKIWPVEEHLNDDIVYWGSMLAFAEMIRGGTTSFCDMYMFQGVMPVKRFAFCKDCYMFFNISDLTLPQLYRRT